MSVFQRSYKNSKTKRWYVSFRLNRERYRFASPTNSSSGAKAYEAILRQRLTNGQDINGVAVGKKESRIFSDLAWDWHATYVKNNNKLSEFRSKKSILKAYLVPYFGDMLMENISSYDIEKYKAERLEQGLSKKYINNTLAVLSRLFKSAKEWRHVDEIPRIKFLKADKVKVCYLSVEESNQLLDASTGILHDLILLALNTGMRFGELIAITWGDIKLDNEVLTVNNAVSRGFIDQTKNYKSRIISLNRPVIKMLEQRKAICGESALVFPNPNNNGGYMLQEHCRNLLHGACRQAGIKQIGWHTLRHTFASRLAENGVPMRSIQELLGHADTTTTMRYAHLSPLITREAVRTLEKPTVYSLGHAVANSSEIEVKIPESERVIKHQG